MKTYLNIADYNITTPSVVTIGTFDGVHKGHQKILNQVKQIAQEKKLTSILLTFFPHPRMVLQPDSDLKLIHSIKERRELVFKNGIEHIITHPFSIDFARTTAHDYVKNILVDQLHAAVVVIGYDHRFGRNRTASITELKEYGLIYGFEVIEISKKEVEAVAVSSTKVRKAIIEGNMTAATAYLGRTYSLEGKIITGKQLGRTLGYPTANLAVNESYKLLPKKGVYITSAVIDNQRYYGMTNIGVNPTIDDHLEQSIETHFLDYNSNLYNRTITLAFHRRLRDEQAFDSLQELQEAMQQDEKNTRLYVQQLG